MIRIEKILGDGIVIIHGRRNEPFHPVTDLIPIDVDRLPVLALLTSEDRPVLTRLFAHREHASPQIRRLVPLEEIRTRERDGKDGKERGDDIAEAWAVHGVGVE